MRSRYYFLLQIGAIVIKGLGPLESEIMQVVWSSREPVTVREVVEQLNDGRKGGLAYTTVMTVMSRLAEKVVLVREPRGRGYAYSAVSTDAAGIAVRELLRDFGETAVARFVDEAKSDPKLRRRLERLMKEAK